MSPRVCFESPLCGGKSSPYVDRPAARRGHSAPFRRPAETSYNNWHKPMHSQLDYAPQYNWSCGNTSTKTQRCDGLQSQWRLPKQADMPSYGLDDSFSSPHPCRRPNDLPKRWAMQTPSRHGYASTWPTRTTAQLEQELEEADIALARVLSLCDEANRQRQLRKEQESTVLANNQERPSDFDIGQWLSDASIARVYSELVAGNLGNISPKTQQPLSADILLMDPAVAFWLIHQDLENAAAAASELNLQHKQLVICPINDNANGGCADGGGHWTLLVAWRSGKQDNDSNSDVGLTFQNFRYYDSMFTGKPSNRNRMNAQKLARTLSGDCTFQLRETRCAQQVNSFDCGVYVICFSEIIASVFMEAKKESRSIENENGDPSWADWIREVSPKSVTAVRRYYFNAFEEADKQSSTVQESRS